MAGRRRMMSVLPFLIGLSLHPLWLLLMMTETEKGTT
jgi:hypothetical protein